MLSSFKLYRFIAVSAVATGLLSLQGPPDPTTTTVFVEIPSVFGSGSTTVVTSFDPVSCTVSVQGASPGGSEDLASVESMRKGPPVLEPVIQSSGDSVEQPNPVAEADYFNTTDCISVASVVPRNDGSGMSDMFVGSFQPPPK